MRGKGREGRGRERQTDREREREREKVGGRYEMTQKTIFMDNLICRSVSIRTHQQESILAVTKKTSSNGS